MSDKELADTLNNIEWLRAQADTDCLFGVKRVEKAISLYVRQQAEQINQLEASNKELEQENGYYLEKNIRLEKIATEFKTQIEQLKEQSEQWVSVDERLPDEGVIVDIYCGTHPQKFNADYSGYKDGSDLTEENLLARARTRKWYKENPIQKGSLYMTAICGLRWRLRGLPEDSRYGFFGDEGVVTHWKPINPPEVNSNG